MDTARLDIARYVHVRQETSMTLRYETTTLPLEDVTPNPDNDYDMDPEGIRGLAKSIERDGLGQLPLVRAMDDGTMMLISGHRRLAAYKLLRDASPDDERWQEIPATVATGMTDLQARALLAVTNLETRQIPSEERTRRILELVAMVPDLKRANPELVGTRATKVAADILREGGVEKINESAVRYALSKEKRRRDAVKVARELSPEVAKTMEAEAQAERVGPAELEQLSRLPKAGQRAAMIEYQRQGGGRAALRRAVSKAGSDYASTADVLGATRRATEALEQLLAVVRAGRRMPAGSAGRIEELAAEVSRTQTRGSRPSGGDRDLLV